MEENKTFSEDVLDSLAVECGEAISENESSVVIDNKDVLEKAVDTTVNRYAYDDGLSPMPGEVVTPTVTDTPASRDNGLGTLIAQTAMMKLEKEKEQDKKKEIERKRKSKDLLAQIMYQQEEMYFVQNKFRMSGQQKRTLRRIIEKRIARGDYDYMLSESIPLN